jgi:hypothetical protein
VDDSDAVLTGSQKDPNWEVPSLRGEHSELYSQAGTLKWDGNNSQANARQLYGYNYPNDAVSVAFDESGENLYISFYDSLLSGLYDSGGIRLYSIRVLATVELST